MIFASCSSSRVADKKKLRNYLHNPKKSITFAPDFALMSEKNHYIIDLSRFPLGMHRFDIQLDNDFFASVEKSEILSGEVAVKAALNLREDDYSLTLTVQGTVFVTCDRCLEPMPIEIDEEQELWASDIEENDESPRSSSLLDLTWLAYEIASINIPIVHSHQQGDCNEQMDLLLQSHLCDEPEPEIDKDI